MTEIETLCALLRSRPRPDGVAERRAALDGLAQAYPVAADVRATPVEANGVAAEWTVSPGADPSRALLFLHGGGFSVGSIASHRSMVAEVGRACGGRTLALDYRRTPEHPFPAAFEDAMAGYRFLLAEGIAPSRIAIGGDSAGGGLTIATLVAIRDAGLPMPACGWCISPWVDMEALGASMESKAAADPMISRPYILQLAGWYLGAADPRTPLAAPLYADLAGLPPLLIQVGTAETLLDDATRIVARAAAADVRVTMEAWPHMIHAWHLFYQQLADGRRAINHAGAYIRAMTP